MKSLYALAALTTLAACSEPPVSPSQQLGADPILPAPKQYLVPPMNVTTPVGWSNGGKPTVPAGFTISAFANGLKGPRNILPLSNGDVLAVEAGGPPCEPISSEPR